jgi:hypothetical protein
MQCNYMYHVMMGNDISLSVNMLDHGIQVALAYTMTTQGQPTSSAYLTILNCKRNANISRCICYATQLYKSNMAGYPGLRLLSAYITNVHGCQHDGHV